jgi:hypothetical protein
MKLAATLATLSASLVPAVAQACPAGASSCGGLGSLSTYVAALGVGLLVGFGSVALERRLRK